MTAPTIVCDICGKPAVYSAVDLVEVMQNGQLVRVPVGKVKYGCNNHPVTSEILGRSFKL